MLKTNKSYKFRFTLNVKIMLGVLILSAVLIIFISLLSHESIHDMVFEFYKEKALTTSELAADTIDGDLVMQALEEGEYSKKLQEQFAKMDQIKMRTTPKYLYLFTIDEDTITYIYTSFIKGDQKEEMRSLGQTEILEDDGIVMNEVLEFGEPISEWTVSGGRWGNLASAYAPVFDSKGKAVALMGVDYDMDEILMTIRNHLKQIIIWVSISVLLLIFCYLLITNEILVNPLKQLTKSADQFISKSAESGNRISYHAVKIRNRDEIGDLAIAFNKMAHEIQIYILSIAKVTAEKERIETELNVARNIQMMFLPKIFPPFTEHDYFDLYAVMNPAKSVGGDFYDFYFIDENHFCFTVADVSGKGVPAALFMVIAKTILKNQFLSGKTPAEVLTESNNQLAENNDENMFVTVFTGVIEISTGIFTFANAGHNLPLICQNGKTAWLESEINLVLAAMEDIRYSQSSIKLNEGDQILLYTDGVTESMNEKGELYGNEKLFMEAQRYFIEPLGVKEKINCFLESVSSHQKEAQQSDDITILLYQQTKIIELGQVLADNRES